MSEGPFDTVDDAATAEGRLVERGLVAGPGPRGSALWRSMPTSCPCREGDAVCEDLVEDRPGPLWKAAARDPDSIMLDRLGDHIRIGRLEIEFTPRRQLFVHT